MSCYWWPLKSGSLLPCLFALHMVSFILFTDVLLNRFLIYVAYRFTIVSSCPKMSIVFLAVFWMPVKYHQCTFSLDSPYRLLILCSPPPASVSLPSSAGGFITVSLRFHDDVLICLKLRIKKETRFHTVIVSKQVSLCFSAFYHLYQSFLSKILQFPYDAYSNSSITHWCSFFTVS